MQTNTDLLEEFEEEFRKIRDEETVPRPDAFGYTRVARQIHKVEVITTRLFQVMARSPKYPLPKEPRMLYELWMELSQNEEFDDLMGAIFSSNPHVFNAN